MKPVWIAAVLVLSMVCWASNALADDAPGDVTVTYNLNGTVTVDPAHGLGAVGNDVIIVNNTGAAITVTVTQGVDGDAEIIIDAVPVPASGGSTSATVTVAGTVTVCEGSGRACEELSFNPIPTVSEWGMVVMMLLVLGAGTLVLMRRRASAAQA
jgi:hypothetical protein